MKVFSKEEASKYVNGLIPSIKNIDDLVAVIQDSKYSNIKESKVFLEEDLNELLRSLKLTLGALYTEDFAKLYLKLDEIPSELRVYFVENSEKKMFLGQDLYEYRLSHSLAEDISIDKVKELISEKLKGFDLDEQKIQKLIDKSLATLSLDTKSIEYLIKSNVSKITNDKILKAVNDKLTEMDLQDTDKVEEARVKSIVETRLNEVIITPTDVRDEVRKEFTSKGISEELLNTVKNFDNNIQEALSKITISDEQIRKACQGLNLTENQTTEVKALLNDYVKLEALTTKLEELKSTISAETDTKISDKAETLVKSEFLTTELAKYVLSTTLDERLAAIQSGVSAEDVDSKITAKLENYVKSEFLNTELEKYISKEALETKLNDIKANLLSEEALSAYVKSEFLTTELEKYAKKSEVYTKEEVDQKVAQGGTFDASSYYQKSEVYSKEESLSKDEINTKLSTKADIVNVYNKSEVDEKIQNIHAGTDENKVNELIDTKIEPLAKKSETYNKSEIDAKVGTLATKEELPSLENYYPKTETYNKSEIDQKVTASGTFDGSQYYNKSEVDSKVNDLTSKITENSEIKEFVKAEIKKVVSNAPESLDTIAEIATALKNNPDVVTEILNKIEAKIDTSVADAKYALKTEVQTPDLSNYYNKSEVDAKTTELAKKSELPSLENYYSKTETYNKSEVDAKVAAGGTFDASSYYQKSDIDSKVEELAKKSETYSKSEVDAKTAELAKKSETYNKSEVDGKIQSIQTGTNEEKVNELIDAKLNPVKTSLFTENAADAKYQTKENAFTKEKADELYLSKTTELKLKGQTSEEISDTDEIPFRTDENSPIKFVAVSKIKGQSGGDLTKPEVEKEVKSQLGAFSLGDGYAIAKALKPYLPNTLRIPDRITTKQLQNFKIKFDLFKAPDGSYGSAMSALLFSRDLVPFYPIYRTKMTSTKRSVFILSQTGKKLTKDEFDTLSEVPENYVLKDNELKIELSIEGTINPYDYTTYSPDNIFIGHKGTGTGYYSMSSTSETTIPYTFVLSISSKNSNNFDTMSFYNGATQGRYSDRIKVTMLNNEEEIFKKMYSDLPNNCSLETIIQLKPRDLVKTLPDTEENKVIEILKEYNKQYIDEKVKANELVNKADLHNELTNNIQETISTEATKIDIVQKMNQVLAYNLKNMAIDYALIPTEKPKETTFIIKDTTRYNTSYGAGFNEIIIFDEDGKRLYLTKCSPNNAKLVDIILSKNPVSTSYDTMQSSGIPESYVLEAGEYRGTIEAKYGYDYLGRFLYGNMNSSLGSYNDEFLKIKIKGLYPSKIRIVSRKDGYYFTDYTVVARNEDDQTIGIKKYSNMLVGNVSEFYTPKIQKSDTITDFTTILDGENAKKVIKSNVDTAVEEKFNSIDFLSSQNLETKINDLMPKIVEKFGDNDGFKNYMKKAFDIIDEDFPEDLKQKPTDFTFTIDKCIKKSGDLPCLGSVTLTDNNGKKLYLKATSQLRDTDKRISIILTTKEEDAITGESGNFIDTDNYQLQEGEYKAYIQSSNQYRNTDYYWCFYIFNLKAANKYNYYLMKSDYGSVTVTIKDFYPKSMTIYNSANDRYLDSYRVRFFDNGTCFLNVRKTNLPYQTTSNIRIPTFE